MMGEGTPRQVLSEGSPRASRTKFTLENCLRMIYHPLGIRDFMKDVNRELNFEDRDIQAQIQLGIATSVDIIKYASYFILAGEIAYDLLSK